MDKFGIFRVRLTVLLFLIVVVSAQANILYQPDNLDFEQGEPGIVPNSWIFPSRLAKAGYIAFVDDKIFYEGRKSVAIDNPHYNADTALVESNENMAAMYQSVDAFPYRNKYVKFGAWVKCKSEERDAHGQLWIVARNEQRQTIISLFGKDDKIIDTNWHYKQIIILVPPDTDELRFGFLIEGKGRLWADDVAFEILSPTDAIDETSKALTDAELEKLISFANIYGNLIHFYPSNQLRENLDGERFLLYVLTELLSAESDYIAELNGILREVAPQAKLIRKKELPKFNIDRPTAITEKIAYAAEIAGGPVVKNSPAFYSKLSNIYATTRSREGAVFQNISVIKYDNMRLEISAWILLNGKSAGSNAQIWCKAEVMNSNEFEFATTSDNPALANEWQEFKLAITLPKNVYNLRLALVFLGEGNAYFDDVSIKLYDGDKFVKNIAVPNGNFELSGSNNTLHSWQTEPEILDAGYSIMRTTDVRNNGNFSLRISSDEETMIRYPELGEIGRFFVNNDYDLVFPLVLMPRNEMMLTNFSDKFSIKGKPTGYNPNYRDRTTRLALVIQLWNIIKHFSLNEIENEVLITTLRKSLTEVAAQSDYDSLMAVLNGLLKLMNDPRANLWNQFVDAKYGLPLVFNQFGHDIIVTTVIDETLPIEPGDKILKIAGNDIQQIIQNYTKSIVAVNDRFAVSKSLAFIRSGRKGSKVSLTISGKDNKPREIEVTRNLLLYDIYEPRPEAIMELDTNVYYVDMTQMSDRTFKRISDQINTAKAFIFDMRGFINMSEHVLSLFSREDISGIRWEIPIYTKPNKELLSRKIIHGDIKGRTKYPDAKVIFLIDETTIGYSEAVASLVEQFQLGTLIGTPTAGAIGETLTTRLIGGFSIAYTGMRAFDKKNNILNSIPIEPSVLLPRNQNKFLNYTELLIEKALEIIRN